MIGGPGDEAETSGTMRLCGAYRLFPSWRWSRLLGDRCHGPAEMVMFWARAVAVGWRGDRTELTGPIGLVPGNSNCSSKCLSSE